MTQVESMIMKIIWDNDGSISTSELIEKIRQKHNKDYARTTVVTFLDKLKKKGYITKTRKRNISYAIANINEHDYKLELLSQQLEFWFNGDANEMLRYINIWHDAEKDLEENKMKDKAIEILKQNEKLYKWLEEKDYFKMPAAIKHHGACQGGLFEHSCSVAAELKNLTDKLGLKWERKESPVIVGLLHDVCKLDDCSLLPFGENDGELGFEYNSSKVYPGHGDKSLIMLMGLIDLTEEEKMCIRYHMGAFTDPKEWEYYSRAVANYPNILYTHTADMIASQILKK